MYSKLIKLVRYDLVFRCVAGLRERFCIVVFLIVSYKGKIHVTPSHILALSLNQPIIRNIMAHTPGAWSGRVSVVRVVESWFVFSCCRNPSIRVPSAGRCFASLIYFLAWKRPLRVVKYSVASEWEFRAGVDSYFTSLLSLSRLNANWAVAVITYHQRWYVRSVH